MLIAAAGATVVTVDPTLQLVQPGEPFSITVQVEDVMNMGADQVFILFEPTALQVTAMQLGPFLKTGGKTFSYSDFDNANGTAYFYEALSSGAVSGSGVLATIEFATNASQAGSFPITLSDVLLADGNGMVIPVETRNGTVLINPQPCQSITITSPETSTYASIAVRLQFAVEPATAATSFWITYQLDNAANVTITGNTTITGLAAGEHHVVLSARDAYGNTVESSTVNFTVHPGDIIADGEVDIFDLQRLAWAFNTQPGDAAWNTAADLNADNTVNIFDVQIFAWNFGNTYVRTPE